MLTKQVEEYHFCHSLYPLSLRVYIGITMYRGSHNMSFYTLLTGLAQVETVYTLKLQRNMIDHSE